MAMQLGALTFNEWTPDDYTLPLAKRLATSVDTFGGVAFFSWGIVQTGQKITISWDVMPTTMFNALDAMIQADTGVTWLPEDGYSYTVQLLTLNGALVTTYSNEYRMKVTLDMVVTGKEALPVG